MRNFLNTILLLSLISCVTVSIQTGGWATGQGNPGELAASLEVPISSRSQTNERNKAPASPQHERSGWRTLGSKTDAASGKTDAASESLAAPPIPVEQDDLDDLPCAEYYSPGDIGFPDASYAWSNWKVGQEVDPEDVAFGTLWVQHYIWKYQHSCGKGHVTMKSGRAGTGSLIHHMSENLLCALSGNKILHFAETTVWAHNNKNENDPFENHCNGDASWTCFLEPLSTCEHPSNLPLVQNCEGMSKENAVLRPIIRLLECSGLDRRLWAIWWNVQTTTYIHRPNAKTLKAMAQLSKTFLPPSLENGMPKGSVSIHVRHGDKFLDMELYDLPAYLKYANQTERPWRVYLSTDDEEVVKDAKKLTYPWVVRWANEDRENHNRLQLQSIEGNDRIIKDILKIKVHLTCDRFIGTLKSNWNLLIQELRMTVGLKNQAIMTNLNCRPQSSCSSLFDCNEKYTPYDTFGLKSGHDAIKEMLGDLYDESQSRDEMMRTYRDMMFKKMPSKVLQ